MSANISIQYGLEQAWHRETVIVPFIKSIEDVPLAVRPMRAAPIFIEDGKGGYIPANGKQTVIDTDQGPLPVAKVIGDDATVIENRDLMSRVIDALAGAGHDIVSVGCYDDFQKFAISVKVAENFKAAGRETARTLNIMNGHGGIARVIAKVGLTVVVCANTYALAMREGGDVIATLKKTKFAASRLPAFERAIEAQLGVCAEFAKAMDDLASVKVSEDQAREFFAGYLATPESVKAGKLSTRAINITDRLVSLFRNGAGNDGNGLDDVFHAVTDYYSHESAGDNRAKQFVSSEYGDGSRSKEEVFQLLTKTTKRGAIIERSGWKEMRAIGAPLVLAA